MPIAPHRVAGLTLAAATAAALAIAMASEWFAGLNPCELCLWQRWPYRIAIGLGLLAAVLPARQAWWALAAIAALLAAEVGLALLHVGVEQRWWPSPLPGCRDATLAGARNIDDLMARLRPAPAKPCDEAAYLVPGVPVSMAAMNLAFAAVLFAGTVQFLLRRRTA